MAREKKISLVESSKDLCSANVFMTSRRETEERNGREYKEKRRSPRSLSTLEHRALVSFNWLPSRSELFSLLLFHFPSLPRIRLFRQSPRWKLSRDPDVSRSSVGAWIVIATHIWKIWREHGDVGIYSYRNDERADDGTMVSKDPETAESPSS